MIAIIAILAGMLLPALNNAKKKAQSLQCLSSLKQDGQMCIMYTGDNQEYFPSNLAIGKNGRLLSWVSYLYAYTGKFGKSADDVSEYLYNNARETDGAGFLEAKKRLIGMACPQSEWIWRENGKDYCYASNYLVNSSIITSTYGATKLPAFKTVQIRQSSKTYLLADAKKDGTKPLAGSKYAIRNYLGYVHSNGANLLFADGHAAGMRRVLLNPPVASTRTTLPYGDSGEPLEDDFLF